MYVHFDMSLVMESWGKVLEGTNRKRTEKRHCWLPLNLDSAVELVERVVANGVIGVGGKFVVTLLVMRTFFP